MHRSISELQLDDDSIIEEDIGTSSPYQPLHSTSAQTSSTTISSLAPSISRIDSRTNGRVPFAYASRITGSSSSLSSPLRPSGSIADGATFGRNVISSSSTPSLALNRANRSALQINGAQTLPRRSLDGKRRVRKAQDNDLVFDEGVVEKLRRWVIGFVIGSSLSHCKPVLITNVI